MLAAYWNGGAADTAWLPANAGTQNELVLRGLVLEYLAVAKLKYLCNESRGSFQQNGQFSTLERKLAQFRQSRLLFRHAVRGSLRLW